MDRIQLVDTRTRPGCERPPAVRRERDHRRSTGGFGRRCCRGDGDSLTGRASVFDGPSDFAYVGRDADYSVSSTGGGRFALCGARAGAKLPHRYGPASGVAVELRGAGNCSRQVHNFATADTFEADSIIACEVITPAGTVVVSQPQTRREQRRRIGPGRDLLLRDRQKPHRDRRFRLPPRVRNCRETYRGARGSRSGDVVLVPHGYHGPSIAAPGHHMYYLNVMAGSGEIRAWNICDDPQHTWLRGSWDHQDIDPRLPLQSHN